ncbi:MAG: DUF3429 domain-containing protein [Alcaligenaceae bacterium]|nr:DUF3429 domain-containing protein [Alcaligenaceae bacterium]
MSEPSARALQPAARTPLAALIPGLLGLLPFWAVALTSVLETGLDPLLALMALIMYGAVILSFVGALWWGMATHAPSHAPRATMFVWSVIPALVGWAATLTAPETGLRMLMAGLALQWLLDGMLRRKMPELLPGWVFRLRSILTGGALVPMAFVWFQIV